MRRAPDHVTRDWPNGQLADRMLDAEVEVARLMDEVANLRLEIRGHEILPTTHAHAARKG
ncbi:MAG TPA: hypothetical protein VFF67_10330 [Thermoplasmata archaeon]|nr:hypothetical protein [Thermoplasmata archaeon]